MAGESTPHPVGLQDLTPFLLYYSQCDAEEWDAVAGGGQSAGLIFKTVADPIYVT